MNISSKSLIFARTNNLIFSLYYVIQYAVMLHYLLRRALLSLTIAASVSVVLGQDQTTAPGSTDFINPIAECNNLYLKATPAGRLELQAQVGSAIQLMGYTDQATPADVEMPDNMRYWLQCVDEAAEDVQQNSRLRLGTITPTTPIAPLLKKIQWNQTSPYDMYCPSGTPVGCVATAVAQVMYYYRYPEHGYGKHKWSYNNKKHEVVYDSAYYQWDLMFDKYKASNCTQEQKEAVALLSYHVGVAINMQYNSGGSGTWSELVPEALRTHFGYNSHISSVYRTQHSFAEWSEILQNELREGRPIVFAANDGQYGHCFVIDGINEEGLYHVNWGWGGYYDGYFDICILNPEGDGTGGGHSNYGYCHSQTCLINFCPEEGVGEMQNPVISSYTDYELKSQQFYIGCYYTNCTGDTLTVIPAVEALCTDNDSARYFYGDTIKLYPYATWSHSKSYAVWSGTTAYPDELPDGHYTLNNACRVIWPVCDTLMTVLTDHHYSEQKNHLVVEDHKFRRDTIIQHMPYPSIQSFNLQNQELTACFDYEGIMEIQNTGDDYFFGEILLKLEDRNSKMMHEIYVEDQNIRIAPGEIYEAHFPICIDEDGDWHGYVHFDDRVMDSSYEIDFMSDEEVFSFTTKVSEESPSKLNLLYVPKLMTTRPQEDGEITFRLLVSNPGNVFESQVAMLFYEDKNHTGTPLLTIAQEEVVEAGCNRDTIFITGQMSELKSGKTYYAWAAQLNPQGIFKRLLRNGEEVQGREVRIYPAAGIEEVRSDEVIVNETYDLMGRPQPADKARRGLQIRGKQIVFE